MSDLHNTWHTLTHAVVVCGHAVYHGGPNIDPEQAPSDLHWHLQSFQKGEPPHYISHIRTGVEQAAEDPTALLIFSGGQTRYPEILSEAQGYHHLATLFNFWGHPTVRHRTTTEEFATDSFDNVLFGIARFFECVSRLPTSVTFISWSFKQKRFEHHAESIHWPMSAFAFLGVGQPGDIETVRHAERRTLALFQDDITGYGAAGGPLRTKKMARNPYRRQHGYATSCSIMKNVLEWRAPGKIPSHLVPWH